MLNRSLVWGGFRAVTGLISKNSPNAAKIQTNTATISLCGTVFDARVCIRDCGIESARVVRAARPNAIQASAKVISTQAKSTRWTRPVNAAGERTGGSTDPGDLVKTGNRTRAVLAIRYDLSISLGAATPLSRR